MFTLIKFLFIGKVDDFCLPVGYTCDNWEMFLEGRCATCEKVQRISQCQLMGLYPTYWKSVIVENKPGVGQKYFLNTAKDGDFCCNSNQFLLMFFIVLFSEFDVWSDVTVYHYQMAFHLSPDSEAKSNGEFELTLNAIADRNLKIADNQLNRFQDNSWENSHNLGHFQVYGQRYQEAITQMA